MPISVFIAEDRQSSRDLLIEYMLFREELRLDGMAKNGEEALRMLSKKKYDLAFLDINLPILSGIEVLEKLKELPYVIFTTAFDKYAIKAFEMGAVDYLLKPFSLERFNQAVDRALGIIGKEANYFKSPKDLGISFKCDKKNYIVPFDEIVYISSGTRHSILYTVDEEIQTPLNLKDVEGMLPVNFIRVHKQYIVNSMFISRLEYIFGGKYEVTLNDSNKTKLPVGRVYYNEVKEKMEG